MRWWSQTSTNPSSDTTPKLSGESSQLASRRPASTSTLRAVGPTLQPRCLTLHAAAVSLRHRPLDDGVAALLRERGFRCAYDECEENNFGGRHAPAMTHWTGTTVDFAYIHGDAWRVAGAYVQHSPLSDHLPLIFDLACRDT